MQKQTIYSYLQRSLVKILSKSSYSNEYKTTLVKPLNTCCTGITGYAKSIKNSIKLVPLFTQVDLQSQTLNFFRKVNSSLMPFLRVLGQVGHQPSLSFTCKFNLISFKRPRFAVLILQCDRSLLLNAKQKESKATKQKLIKLNQSLNNDQLSYYFIAKLLDTYFYLRTLCCNKKMIAIPLYPPCPWAGCLKSKKGTPFRQSTGIERLAQRACTAKGAPKTEALLLANSFDQRLSKAATNFDFYNKQSSQVLFRQSFYKRKDKSKHYMKTFHNVFYFFSFFSFTTNKKVSFLNSAELAAAKQFSFTRYAQQVLYLHKINGVTCCFQLFCFSSINLESLETLYFLQNKTNITEGCPKASLTPKRHQIQCFSFSILCFLTIIFYVAIKYIKQFKKQVDDPVQAMLIKNNSIYQFNQIIDFNFLSFKPFFRKLIVSGSAFNSLFFLMRPLFSLTRLDTFFICESLKLPIYPDKSNLRVDFLRNRIRKQILPAIRILLNPQFDTILCKFYE